jgi:hypothetical protein
MSAKAVFIALFTFSSSLSFCLFVHTEQSVRPWTAFESLTFFVSDKGGNDLGNSPDNNGNPGRGDDVAKDKA